ncbi:sirohydrochlorin chelatase [Neptunomonas marina]|uniref:Sirohydrochlorin chelatase n=1 Tax=Neptunomonas marina TaxID=1815562 RepID=A0A437Q486_9GAMM|nr:sirohydrochlorin chelatase [Neptunomonas marina]
MICGHGSRDKAAETEFGKVALALRERFPETPVEYGFLEYSAPNIHMGLDKLVAEGCDEIIAVPGMLFAATHAKNDIPSVLTTFAEKHPGLTVHYGRELGLHTSMIAAFEGRIYEALGYGEDNRPAELYDTLLVVVGRGTSDTEANAEVAKLTRIVNENMGFGWASTVYSGVTYPSVGVGLEQVLKLGFKRVVVAPYFLFTGRLIKRINAYIDRVAAAHPDVEIITAGYLNDHAHVIDTFVDRITEAGGEQVGDESLMDSFQRRLAAGEVDVHHHHAEYRDHDHDHQHDHGHSHGVYRHIGHPLGPRTMIGEGVCCCFMRQFPDDILEEERARIEAAPDETPIAHR